VTVAPGRPVAEMEHGRFRSGHQSPSAPVHGRSRYKIK
jgi:hypothetical protein